MKYTNFTEANAKRLQQVISPSDILLVLGGEDAANMLHKQPSSFQLETIGLKTLDVKVAVEDAESWSLTFIHSERKINRTALRQAVDVEVERVEKREGRKVSRKERVLIKDNIFTNMLAVAPIVDMHVELFFHEPTRMLICNSDKHAGKAFNILTNLLGTVKTETIHVGEVKNIVGKILLKSLEEGSTPRIGQCGYGDKLNLRSSDGENTTVKFTKEYTTEHVIDLLRDGMTVDLARLSYKFIDFDLTKDFKFKGIKSNIEPGDEVNLEEDYDYCNNVYTWANVSAFAHMVDNLATTLLEFDIEH